MMTEEDIVAKLKKIGFEDSEIPDIMRDVVTVISGKVIAAYLPSLPEADRARIATLQPDEFPQYLQERGGSLPAFPQAQFDAIHDDTWRDYFKSVS